MAKLLSVSVWPMSPIFAQAAMLPDTRLLSNREMYWIIWPGMPMSPELRPYSLMFTGMWLMPMDDSIER